MKKINIGIVLIILTLISLGIYLVIKSNNEELEKLKIKSVLEDYMKTYDKYLLLDEEDRNINKNISGSKYKTKYLAIKEEFSKYYKEERKDYLFNEYYDKIEMQIDGQRMIFNFNQEIEDIDYYFYDNYVTVIYTSKVEYDIEKRENISLIDSETKRHIGKSKREKSVMVAPYRIALFEKIGSEYKLVYTIDAII